MVKKLNNLVVKKPVIGAPELSVVKYRAKVFHDNLWGLDKDLLETRGRVIDSSGNTVALPLKKVFNYLENGAGSDLKGDTMVQAIVKINGSMLHVTNTPYGILYGTTGNAVLGDTPTDNEFLNRGRDLFKSVVTWDFFNDIQKGSTFIFEVVDNENDPHIVNDEDGLYLLGVRNPSGILLKHHVVVGLAQLSNIYRGHKLLKTPASFECRFQVILDVLKNVRHEGFMIKLVGGDDFVCKLKSPYYLNKKRAQRLSAEKLFSDSWREYFDDDFYATIMEIRKDWDKERWSELAEETRSAVFEGTYSYLLRRV